MCATGRLCRRRRTDVSGNAQTLAGTRVRMTPDPETFYNRLRSGSAMTDQIGHFSFTCVAPGKYRVVARSPAGAGTVPDKSEPQSVTFSERAHKTIEVEILNLSANLEIEDQFSGREIRQPLTPVHAAPFCRDTTFPGFAGL